MTEQTETPRGSGTGHAEGEGAAELGNLHPAELARAAAELAKENPHTAIAGALAVGFLLGGGLTPRLLVSIGLFAGRRYLAAAAREALAGAVEEQLQNVTAAATPGPCAAR
jgi:hypothetical protein